MYNRLESILLSLSCQYVVLPVASILNIRGVASIGISLCDDNQFSSP